MNTTEEQKSGSDEHASLARLENLVNKTSVDYMQEGLVFKLDKLLEGTAIMVTELRQNPILHVKDLRLNKQAIARVTSSRKKFIPTKMIALNVIIEDYSELRSLKDFAGFKNLKSLRYDRVKFF